MNVKDDTLTANDTGVAVSAFYVIGRFPSRRFGIREPSLQRLFRIGMDLPKLAKPTLGDYAHGLSYHDPNTGSLPAFKIES